MTGADFKILVKSLPGKEKEAASIINRGKQYMYEIYRQEQVDSLYVLAINKHIKENNIQKPENSNIKINSEKGNVNSKSNSNIVATDKEKKSVSELSETVLMLAKLLADAQREIQQHKDTICRMEQEKKTTKRR